MPLMVNPNTGKLVDVAAAYVGQLSRAGFKEQEPEAVAPKKGAAPIQRKGRSRKSDD